MKDVHLTSAPDSGPGWPVAPVYEPLWPVGRIRQEFEALVSFRGAEATPVLDQDAALNLMGRMAGDYDTALSKEQFDNWQLKGLLEGKP